MKYIAIIVLSLLSPIFAFSEESIPDAPAGFQWKKVDEVKFQFLHPEGWFFKYEVVGNTHAFFSTKEEITPNANFQTGLSVNIVINVKQDTDLYIEKFFNAYKARNKLSYFERVEIGPFKGIKYGIIIKFDDGSEITTANFILSNKSKGTIFIIIFESPSSIWEQEWKIGKIIMANLLIDDEI